MAEQIRGLAELDRKLAQLSSLQAYIAPAVEAAGRFVLGEAQELVPVDTGNLQESLTLETEAGIGEVSATVYTDTDYALYVEIGTYRQEAQPYLYPALKDNERKIAADIARAANKQIKAIARGRG